MSDTKYGLLAFAAGTAFVTLMFAATDSEVEPAFKKAATGHLQKNGFKVDDNTPATADIATGDTSYTAIFNAVRNDTLFDVRVAQYKTGVNGADKLKITNITKAGPK